MTLTAQQVQDAIENPPVPITYTYVNYKGDTVTAELEPSEFYGDWYGENKTKTLPIDGVEYPVEFVDEFGGMDMGSTLWVVFKVGDQLFKKNGWYASHDGSYWDGSVDEVKPVQKTVTVFE